MWLPINLPFGLFGTFFIVPIYFFLRPFSKKNALQNLIVLVILAAHAYGLYELYIYSQVHWFKLVKSVLVDNSCYRTDLYAFITLTVVPALLLIKQCLLFRVNTVIGESEI